ncbi:MULTISPECIES: LysR family transcriptional regulator [Streptomyces]|uniref:LysR family transcriptional regulator n=2 Tax=Streptomyces TaxID=1883 RepID=A0ABV9J3G0_9ACTN
MSVLPLTSPSHGDADLNLRLVRYFTVVAEHGNFGRAAAELHVAQPSLSRQIQRLERQLGARLFDRTPQGSSLSPAGAAFLPQAHRLLETARAAVATTRAASEPRTLTIGYVDDLIVTPAVRAVRESHPDARVIARHVAWKDADVVVNGAVNALVARLPLACPTSLLHTTVLYEEPRVLVIPESHSLAGRTSVTLDDFANDAFVKCAATSADAWTTFWRAEPRPDGSNAPVAARVDTFEDKLELIAEGHAIAIFPLGDRRTTLRKDLVTVPVVGIEPCKVAVVTRADSNNELVDAFIAAARRELVSPTN